MWARVHGTCVVVVCVQLNDHMKQFPHFMAGLRLVLAVTCKLAVSAAQQQSSLSDLVNEYIGDSMRFPALHRVLLPCILCATATIRARFLDRVDNLGVASSTSEALVVMRLFKCLHYLVRIVMTSYAHDKMHRVGSDTAEDFDALCLQRLTLLLVTVCARSWMCATAACCCCRRRRKGR